MKKSMFFLLLFCLLLTGCWDRRELNELAITLAIGIDKVDEGYQVTAQVVVPSEVSMNASTGRSPVTLFQESGETVYEALRKITKDSPRKVYPAHLRMLIIGEELAEEGIGESLELMSRDWELRADFYVVVAKDATAGEILNVTTTLESIPAEKMYSTLKTSERSWAATNGITLDEVIEDFTSEGKEAVLTGIQVFGDQKTGTSRENIEKITPSARIRYDHLAVFQKDKLVGWLTEKESRGYNDIINSVKNTVTAISCPDDGRATIEITQLKSEVKGNIKKGQPEIDVKIKVDGNVGEVECQIDLSDENTIKELEKITEKEMEEINLQTIERVQKYYQTDVLGFGQAIHRSHPKEWKKLKGQWDEEFPDLKVNVNVDVKIGRVGTVNNSFLDQIKD